MAALQLPVIKEQPADLGGLRVRTIITTPRMFSRKPSPAPEGTEPERDRRAKRIPLGSWRWLRSLLYRPLALERRNKQLHITLAERRRSAEVIQAESLERLRDELSARLVTLDSESADTTMRHLVMVHDMLGHQGWPGVQTMSSQVLRKAGQQARLLHELEPSKRLEKLTHSLRLLQTAAEVREEKALRTQQQAAALARASAAAAAAAESAVTTQPGPDTKAGTGPDIEISEASSEDFDAMQRVWEATREGELNPDATLAEPAEPATTAQVHDRSRSR
jgi:hypothetical protein